MIKIDIHRSTEPRWIELGHGAKVQVALLNAGLLAEARADDEYTAFLTELVALRKAEEESDEAPRLTRRDAARMNTKFTRAVARLAILDWEGVGDHDGAPLPVSDGAIDALMDLDPIIREFEKKYVAPALEMEAEKNASSPSQKAGGKGEKNTADCATGSAKIARSKSTSRKPSKASAAPS